MKKQIFILLCLVTLPLVAQQESLDIQLHAPKSVVAGNDFEVNLVFKKGDLKDYSRFSQDLPSGFTAENIESPNADFTFTDQRVRIIWLKLPAEKTVEVGYSINVNERLSGTLELKGTFAYVANGERAFLNVANPVMVEILPNPDIDQDLVVDIADFNSIKIPVDIVDPDEIVEPKEFATVIRQEPFVENNGIVYVSLLVKKPVGTNFLKLEEMIPGGYTFESIDASLAVVSQASSIARFVWMKMPSANSFLVKYRLIPILEKDQEEIKLEGNLTFTDAGETKVVSVKEIKVNLDVMNNTQHMLLLEKGTIPEGLPAIKPQLVSEVAPVKKTITPEVKKERKSDVISEKKQYKKSSGPSFIDIDELKGSEGVYFRVQVSAVKNPYFANIYFADYELLKDAKVERIKGWTKYTVGSVSTYNQAVQLKERIISETPQSSAFVVAYKDGNRVSLDEVNLN
jgi:hypothetical protein